MKVFVAAGFFQQVEQLSITLIGEIQALIQVS
jgi:hypothetical protein